MSRLRGGFSSGWNSNGIIKFIGFSLDVNSGKFPATICHSLVARDKFVELMLFISLALNWITRLLSFSAGLCQIQFRS